MVLKILGSGTIKTASKRNCSGYLIDNKIIMDCGPGVWRSLAKNKIAVDNIGLILITHFHIDHVGDLPAFFMEKYLSDSAKTRPVKLAGPHGINNWFETLSAFSGNWIKTLPVELTEFSINKLRLENYVIQAEKTGHTENSLCYKITDNSGKSIFYSGDTGYNPDLIRIAANCHLGILEVSNTEETKISGHLTPSLAGQIAGQAEIHKMVATHLYPEVWGTNFLEQIKQNYNGEIVVAEDNLELTV